MYVHLPYFFLAVAGRRLPMLAEDRKEQNSKSLRARVFTIIFLRSICLFLSTKPNPTRTGHPFLLRLSRRWVRDRRSDLLSRLHQHSRILLLRLSARWRNFKGRLWIGGFSSWEMKTGSWRFSCVKQSKQDVILPHLRFMYNAEKTVLVFLNNLWGLGTE